jgi:hypothetical protein
MFLLLESIKKASVDRVNVHVILSINAVSRLCGQISRGRLERSFQHVVDLILVNTLRSCRVG